jgi:hypothetical protein
VKDSPGPVEPGQLVVKANGPFRVFKWPEPGRKYSLGVDTAAGIHPGDPCAVEVIEMETCEQVAEWYGWARPHAFGPIVALIGWRYNDAEVGIETHPSPHGLAVYDACEAYGYQNLFAQKQWDRRESVWQVRKGWITSEVSKGYMMNRVAKALADELPIHSKILLQELLDARMSEREQIERRCRNDAIMAYAIALKIRDLAYQEGRQPEPEAPRLDFAARWWENFNARTAGAGEAGAARYDTAQLYPESF